MSIILLIDKANITKHINGKGDVTETARLYLGEQLWKVVNMTHLTHSKKNKQQKHSKVYFEQYLYNSSEPQDNFFSDATAELQAELLLDSSLMKRRFRRTAQRMRMRYS
jgi:spore coat polysaccharide biosynthesis protein SpsF (cytidylyltransferase family)